MAYTNRPMGTPRIAPVSAPDAEQEEALAKVPLLPDGSRRNIFLTIAQHPVLLKRFNAFAGTFFAFSKLTAYDREVLILRVAGRIGSRYEYAQHLPIALEAGLGEERIAAIMEEPGAPPLPAPDQLLVEVVDEMVAAGGVSDRLWERLAERYEDDALLELLFTIGFYRMTGDVLNTVGVEVEEG